MRARVASPNGPRVSAVKPRTAAHPAKLDSGKFDDEAARPNRGLIESCIRSKFSIAYLVDFMWNDPIL